MALVLLFTVSSQRVGVLVADIERIVRSVAITILPGSPAVVEGVIDVHGTLVPVLDLRKRFGLPAENMRLSDLLVIASSGARRVAFRTGSDISIVEIDQEGVQSSPDSLLHSPFVSGLVKLPDGLLVIHELNAFLAEAESEMLARALAQKEAERAA